MFRNVLVPLDGSKLSEAALDMAQRLVEGTNTNVTLLAVGELPETYVAWLVQDYPSYGWPIATGADVERGVKAYDAALKDAESQLNDYLQTKAATLRRAGIPVSHFVAFGNPADTIIRCAKAYDIDVIAMATHGRTGLGHLAFGSVTEAVIRSGIAPVLVIRPEGLKAKEASQEAVESEITPG